MFRVCVHTYMCTQREGDTTRVHTSVLASHVQYVMYFTILSWSGDQEDWTGTCNNKTSNVRSEKGCP